MSNNTRPKADYAPNEKKVWRPEMATQVIPDPALGMEPGIYFISVEELQGAWIDGEWEEAESSETWTETYVDDDGYEVTRTIHKDVPRSRRYTLKMFDETGYAGNVYNGGFGGPRRYKK